MSDEPKLPKEELLRKLLKMTTATNDGECLTAIRKANELLRTAGWDWDKLLDGKIKIVENPFKNVSAVSSTRREFTPPPPKPTAPPAEGMMWELNYNNSAWELVRDPAYRKRRPPMPSYSPGIGKVWVWNNLLATWEATPSPKPVYPSQPSSMPGSTTKSFGGGKPHGFTRTNNYANSCWCCGNDVAVKAGVIFNPQKDFGCGLDKWQTMCEPCNQAGAFVPSSKAPRTYQPAGAPAPGSVNIGTL